MYAERNFQLQDILDNDWNKVFPYNFLPFHLYFSDKINTHFKPLPISLWQCVMVFQEGYLYMKDKKEYNKHFCSSSCVYSINYFFRVQVNIGLFLGDMNLL